MGEGPVSFDQALLCQNLELGLVAMSNDDHAAPRNLKGQFANVSRQQNQTKLRSTLVARSQAKHKVWFALVALVSFSLTTPILAQTPAAPLTEATSADPLTLTANDRVLGKPDAPITIIEYGSLTCSHCAEFDTEVLPKLKEKWLDSGRAKLVFRPFPRNDIDLHASTVALCVAPDRFYAFAGALFSSQEQWLTAPDPKAALARIALLGGVNKDKFNTCWDDKAIGDNLLASRLVASQKLGVVTTPTLFINGRKFDSAPTADAIDAALTTLAGI
jgi:protein-disulfide isomerase